MKQLAFLISLLWTTYLYSGSVEKPELDKSAEAELKSFTLSPGYEINLFASEKDGIANPITMRWDARGRLWVLCSWAYPQIEPTKEANDKLIILEDTNHDGRADKTTIYADKLHMPMGFALGEGGVFIAAGRDLLFTKDLDGDDKADTREIFFTGFGTGDTHQNINSLTWSPDGELYFTQGLHTFSRVETPWGIERLDEHGAWRLRPRRRQLHAFPRVIGGGNPWGIEFGSEGEVLVKSNGKGFGDLIPSLIPNYLGNEGNPNIGETKIKSMIVKKIDSPHLPNDIQGDLLIAGYMAGDINRLDIQKDGSNYMSNLKPNLIDSSSRSFRPVDIQIGPEGAIYIADWYNPIIGHYQASLRHPDRDKTHGRIWRITAKGRPLADRPELIHLKTQQLIEKLSSTRSWERYHSRRLLSEKDTETVVRALQKWCQTQKNDKNLIEALCVYASHEHIEIELLKRLLDSKVDRVRALATRLTGRWHDRVPNPLSLLKQSIQDQDPRVRLEALVAISNIKDPESIKIILNILDHKMDTSIYSALNRATQSLQSIWEPALVDGRLNITSTTHLAHLMKSMKGEQQYHFINQKLDPSKLEQTSLIKLLLALAQNPNPKVQSKVFELGHPYPQVLSALNMTKVKPNIDFSSQLKFMIEHGNIQAMELVGAWNYQSLLSIVEDLIHNSKDLSMRNKAIKTYSELKKHHSIPFLQKVCQTDPSISTRLIAFKALFQINLQVATKEVPTLLHHSSRQHEIHQVIRPFLNQRSGLSTLIKAIKKSDLSSDKIGMMRSALISSGKSTIEFDKLFYKNHSEKVGLPKYSSDLISKLVQSMKTHGNINKGKSIYTSAKASCTACHQINGVGGLLGPDLSALGNALSPELIVESVLWPKRQLKEGYISTTFNTKKGTLVQGNLVSENDKTITLKDVNGKVTQWDKSQITSRHPDSTLMPEGLVAALSHEELRDMLTYLTSLK